MHTGKPYESTFDLGSVQESIVVRGEAVLGSDICLVR